MADKHRFRVALRRNAQLRNGEPFRQRLASEVGWSRPVIFLPPEESIALEDRFHEFFREGIDTGSVVRCPNLTWEEVESALEELAKLRGDTSVVVLMHHHLDLAFPAALADFCRHAKELLRLDGDTIWGLLEEGESGVGVDFYEERGKFLYEVITWGRLRADNGRGRLPGRDA